MFALLDRLLPKWWRNRFKALEASEFEVCSECEMALRALARDMGMSVSEFRSIDLRGPKAADLLLRRMAVLGLDPGQLNQRDPAVMRDLQRVCTLCRSRPSCAWDLEHNAPPKVWQSYCPNSGTLAALKKFLLSARASGSWVAPSGTRPPEQ